MSELCLVAAVNSDRVFAPARRCWADVLPLFETAEVKEHRGVFRLHYFGETDWRPEAARHRILTYQVDGQNASTADVCFEALRWTADLLCRPPIRWKEPRKPIEVYLFDVTTQVIRPRPSTQGDSNGVIVRLGVAGGWATQEAEVRWLAGTAAHEMGHAMLLAQSETPWTSDASLLWMSEGIAVWLQAAYDAGSLDQVLTRGGEWLGYASRWLRETEEPLDWPPAACQAFMFFQYLIRSRGVKVLHGLSGTKVQAIWEVLEKAADLGRDELFEDYAVHAYWLNEPDGPCYAPAIVQRFGGICPLPSATLGPRERHPFSGVINAFGRLYYRIEPRGANRLVVQRTAADDSVTIIAGAATDDCRRIGDPKRITTASDIQLDTAGHVFIVVAGRSAASSKPFAFEVTAR